MGTRRRLINRKFIHTAEIEAYCITRTLFLASLLEDDVHRYCNSSTLSIQCHCLYPREQYCWVPVPDGFLLRPDSILQAVNHLKNTLNPYILHCSTGVTAGDLRHLHLEGGGQV